MITSGLVITLSSDAQLAAQAIADVSARPEFTPGERNGRWLPVAMEARNDDASRDLHDWLHALPGVEFVDVVSVNFEDEDDAPCSQAPFGLRRQSAAATALSSGQITSEQPPVSSVPKESGASLPAAVQRAADHSNRSPQRLIVYVQTRIS